MLTGMGVARATTESVCTVVSELVSNAQMHGAPPVELRVRADGDVVEVAVHDASPVLPRVRDVTPGQGGYGLRIVAAMSHDWGARADGAGGAGKTVWCRVLVRAQQRRGPSPGLTDRA